MIAISQPKQLHSIAAMSRLVGMDRRTVTARIKKLCVEPDAIDSNGYPLFSTQKARTISVKLTPGARKFGHALIDILKTPGEGEGEAAADLLAFGRSIFDPNIKPKTTTVTPNSFK